MVSVGSQVCWRLQDGLDSVPGTLAGRLEGILSWGSLKHPHMVVSEQSGFSLPPASLRLSIQEKEEGASLTDMDPLSLLPQSPVLREEIHDFIPRGNTAGCTAMVGPARVSRVPC